MNKSNLIITLVINTLVFVMLIGCYETVDPNTSSTTKNQQSEQNTKNQQSEQTKNQQSEQTKNQKPERKKMKQYSNAPEMTIDQSKTYKAIFQMENGKDFIVELYAKEAPIAVNSFVFLARDGFYDGVTFHRVIPGFMAQGGDPTGTGMGGPGYKFETEISTIRKHTGPGILSMANAGGTNTNGSQFFVTFDSVNFLDTVNEDNSPKDCNQPGVSCHTVFGKVVNGLENALSISPRDPATAKSSGDAIKTITIEESN
tara:strand:+ start:5512 stop:6282 length:771 start_codon:yes stop_codon:yes gene_type:complete